jgi:3-methylcrotonyl-CoA carboxylase beta subunit
MEHLSDLVHDLRDRVAQARLGGSEKARQKHHERGKLTARERVDRLLDPGSPFLELSALAAIGMYDDRSRAPASSPASAGCTGYSPASSRSS